ncbi:hypothetical protein BC833DRAFT_603818 [Globomyces pollinis-pini]|nr:hypothetical protein BC833DRAFT_603818 [Globomyces pollinis-pini]
MANCKGKISNGWLVPQSSFHFSALANKYLLLVLIHSNTDQLPNLTLSYYDDYSLLPVAVDTAYLSTIPNSFNITKIPSCLFVLRNNQISPCFPIDDLEKSTIDIIHEKSKLKHTNKLKHVLDWLLFTGPTIIYFVREKHQASHSRKISSIQGHHKKSSSAQHSQSFSIYSDLSDEYQKSILQLTTLSILHDHCSFIIAHVEQQPELLRFSKTIGITKFPSIHISTQSRANTLLVNGTIAHAATLLQHDNRLEQTLKDSHIQSKIKMYNHADKLFKETILETHKKALAVQFGPSFTSLHQVLEKYQITNSLAEFQQRRFLNDLDRILLQDIDTHTAHQKCRSESESKSEFERSIKLLHSRSSSNVLQEDARRETIIMRQSTAKAKSKITQENVIQRPSVFSDHNGSTDIITADIQSPKYIYSGKPSRAQTIVSARESSVDDSRPSLMRSRNVSWASEAVKVALIETPIEVPLNPVQAKSLRSIVGIFEVEEEETLPNSTKSVSSHVNQVSAKPTPRESLTGLGPGVTHSIKDHSKRKSNNSINLPTVFKFPSNYELGSNTSDEYLIRNVSATHARSSSNIAIYPIESEGSDNELHSVQPTLSTRAVRTKSEA